MKESLRALLIAFCFTLLFLIALYVAGCDQPATQEYVPDVNGLLVLDDFYGANYLLIRDVFEQYGWRITNAAMVDTVSACPFHGHYGTGPVIPDIRLSDVADISRYDFVAILSSSRYYKNDPYANILNSPPALAVIRAAVDSGLPVFSICNGARVLAAAGVIDGRRVIGAEEFAAEIEAAGGILMPKDRQPIIDGPIITAARGQYYNQSIGLVISDGREKAGLRGDKTISAKGAITIAPAAFGDSAVVWARTLGSPVADGARAVCPTRDDGYLVAGYTFSDGRGDADMLVAKIDKTGNLLWTRLVGGAGDEYAYGCAAVDGGYLVTGYTGSYGSGSKDVFLVKLDTGGVVEWTRTYGGASWDIGTGVAAASDGYVVAAYTNSSGAGEEDAWIIKTDFDGKKIWSHTYGGPRLEVTGGVFVDDDGNIVVGVSTGSFGDEGNVNMGLIKIDGDGKELWRRGYGATGETGHGFDWGGGLAACADGGYLAAGYSDCNDLMDAVVVKTDAAGTTQWITSLGNRPFYDYGHAVIDGGDGYFVIGTTKFMRDDARLYDNDVYVAGLALDGTVRWEKNIGGDESDWGSAACLSPDGCLVVAGHTFSAGAGVSDACIVKIKVN